MYFYPCCYRLFLHFYRFDVPEGLIFLLRNFVLKPGETPEDGTARFYKRLRCLLWVSLYIFRHMIPPEIFTTEMICIAIVSYSCDG